MNELENQIIELKLKLERLEQEKHNRLEHEKKEIHYNFNILNNEINKRKTKVQNDQYSKSCIGNKFIDRDMILPLESIYNILIDLNKRITKLEASCDNSY